MSAPKQDKARDVVRRSLVAGLVAVILVIAGIAIATISTRSASLVRGEFLRRATADTRGLAASLAGPLERRYLRTARTLLASAADLPDVVEATLVDASGRIVGSSSHGSASPRKAGADAPAYYRLPPDVVEGTLFEEGSPEAGPDAVLLVWPVAIGGEERAEGEEAGERELAPAEFLGSLAVRVSTVRTNAALRANLILSSLMTLGNAAVAGLVLFFLIVRAGLRPVNELLNAVERMASGDLAARVEDGRLGALASVGSALNAMWSSFGSLTQRVVSITDHLRSVSDRLWGAMEEIGSGSESQAQIIDETGTLLGEVNGSIRDINRQIDELSNSTEEASSSVLEMGGSVEEVTRNVASLSEAVESASSSSQEMGASIRQVAESADAVRSMAEETAASMSEMDRAIREVGEHVREASELASKVSAGADEGSEAVGATIQGIEEIRTLTLDAKEVLERLAARIGEIGAFVHVIGEINDETKLLSLNAAIIAAQAGEQGKAFAVVANHVKTLAQRTATSTQQIARLIGNVQDESKNAVAAMSAGIQSVEVGVERSRRAGEALEGIRSLASETNSRVSEITRAAQEQARNSAHVTEAANRTSAMVEKISTAMTEQSRASEQMLQTSESTSTVCRQVQQATKEQRDSVSFITRSIYSIREMMDSIHENVNSHSRASEAVGQAVSEVLDVARKTGAKVPELAAMVQELREDAEALAGELGRFRSSAVADAAQAPPDRMPSKATTSPA